MTKPWEETWRVTGLEVYVEGVNGGEDPRHVTPRMTLAAAAPDMYRALEAIVHDALSYSMDPAQKRAAIAALRKARGE